MEWIDVKKQMPPHMHIVFIAYEDEFDCCPLAYFDAEDCAWYYDSNNEPVYEPTIATHQKHVRYWMPVPPLPCGKNINKRFEAPSTEGMLFSATSF